MLQKIYKVYIGNLVMKQKDEFNQLLNEYIQYNVDIPWGEAQRMMQYDTRYQNMLSQINQEISNKQNQYNTALSILQSDRKLAEDIKQFNEQMAYQRERDRIKDSQWQQEYNLSLQKYRASLSSSGSSSSARTVSDTKTVSNKEIENKTNSNAVTRGAQLATRAVLALNGYGVR